MNPAQSLSRTEQILLSLGFLTRIPVRLRTDLPANAITQSVWAFPLIGAFVGLISAVAMEFAFRLGLPQPAAAIIALAVSIVLTGALHEDGLADTADGLGGGRDTAAKLAIMRDSRIGTYGVLALLVCFGLKAACLAQLGGHGAKAIFGALIACHAGARTGLPMMMARMVLARADGAAAAVGRPSAESGSIALLTGGVILVFCLGIGRGILGIAVAMVMVAVIARLARRQIGGYTGDILGAAEQLGETAILFVAASGH